MGKVSVEMGGWPLMSQNSNCHRVVNQKACIKYKKIH